MTSDILQRRRRANMYLLMITGITAALIYTGFSDGFRKPMPVINGIIIGGLLGIFVSITEKRVFDEQLRRRFSFLPLLIIRIIVYSFLIVVVLLLVFSVSRVFWFDLSYLDVWRSEEFRTYLNEGDFVVAIVYTIGIISLVVFSYQITRKLGQGYLENIITGRYYNPHQEDRVFCFLRIHGIENISLQLSSEDYYSFVNDVIYDITNTILSYGGIIYQYVEGEMVINWSPLEAAKDCACIRCYFGIYDKLFSRREYYLDKYGHFPLILCAIHTGRVVHGEIGHGRTEIAFYGDTLNTTSRILMQTTPENRILISEQTLALLEIPVIYSVEEQGEKLLAGKRKPIQIFHISERALRNEP